MIGILFGAAGALVLGSMVWGFLGWDRLDLNPAVLLLPVGIGLLRGQTSSQWWASVWLVLGYAFCLVLVVADLTRPGQINFRWGDVSSEGSYSSPVLITCCVLTGAVLAALHWLLRSPKAAEYFRQMRVRALRERLRRPLR